MTRTDAEHILITDIGSTTTKALLIAREGAGWRFAAEAEAPTTVEKPTEDVRVGVRAAVSELERASGLKLLGADGLPVPPYLSTSSAGGGLQMLVFGLTSTDTGKVAKLTAHAAGGVILKTFTVDDGIPVIHKMRMIRDLHPDVVLLAGGVDDGNVDSLVRHAEILSLAGPSPKFELDHKLPLVYCGNPGAVDHVRGVLEDRFEIHVEANIRPTLLDVNPGPARDRVLRLFMDTVMQRAPGYTGIRDWTHADILPTPTGVERIMRLYAAKTGADIAMVDIGGATTDIFSTIYGDFRRTVAANIGTSFSLANVLAEAGYEALAGHLPAAMPARAVRNYLANKVLNPTRPPATRGEALIELAAATEGVALAWDQHRETNFQVAHLGFLDRLRLREDFDPFEEAFWGQDRSQLFQISDVDLLIGTGGVIAHAASRHDRLRLLVDGFRPSGLTRVAVDRRFKSPHLGVFAKDEPEAALALFESECLEELAQVVAPLGALKPGAPALAVHDRASGRRYSVRGDEVLYLPEGGDLLIRGAKGVHVTKNRDTLELASGGPVLLDCRGRGDHWCGRSLTRYGIAEFTESAPEPESAGQSVAPRLEHRGYRVKRALPYAGEIFVAPGDAVEPETKIGENVFTPPRLYIVDLRRMIGYQEALSQEQIDAGLLVKPGDTIRSGQNILRVEGGLAGHYFCKAPLRGLLLRVEPGGLLVMREIQDYGRDPVVLDVAGELGVDPRRIRRYLQFNIGDFIQRDETVARLSERLLPQRELGGERRAAEAPGLDSPVVLAGRKAVLRAPSSGTLKSIDTRKGTVTIQYDLQPIVLRSFLRGTVTAVEPGLHAIVEGEGSILNGAIGFGHESVGALCLLASAQLPGPEHGGKLLVAFEPIDRAHLEACAEFGAHGLVAPSIDAEDWVDFHGKEIGVALTGEEDIPFSLLLTEGFGRRDMNAEYAEFLRGVEGRKASLCGRTQIRAGVTRPFLVV